jgi:hypothetical protein
MQGSSDLPIRETGNPFLSCIRIRENPFESLLYIKTRARGTGEINFCKQLFHVGDHDVRPFNTILSWYIG